jgi:hypothetical protein
MTAGWCARTIRTAVFAAVCVLLNALGHVMKLGFILPWWTMAAGFVATSGVGWYLAGRERRLPLVVSAVALAQGALHSVFSLAQPSASGSGTDAVAHHLSGDMSSMSMGSMNMDAMDMGSMRSMSTGHSAHAGQLGHLAHGMGDTSSLGMLAAHTLAAPLSGLWLAHDERAAFRVLRAVAGWLAAPLRLPLALPAPPCSRRPARERAERVLWLPLAHTLTSRGPPAGTAVV